LGLDRRAKSDGIKAYMAVYRIGKDDHAVQHWFKPTVRSQSGPREMSAEITMSLPGGQPKEEWG
jgi:hypothetical protein